MLPSASVPPMGTTNNAPTNAGNANADFLAAATKAAEKSALSEPIRPSPEGTRFVALDEPQSGTTKTSPPREYWSVGVRRLVGDKDASGIAEDDAIWFLNNDTMPALAEIMKTHGPIKGTAFALYGTPRQFKRGGGVFTAYDDVRLVRTGTIDLAAIASPKRASRPVDRKIAIALLEAIRASTDPKGAQWDDLVANAKKNGVNEDDADAALNLLMDRGEVYEPILGRLRVTEKPAQANATPTATA